MAGNAERENKKTRINPTHIHLAIRIDDELSKLVGDATIVNCGVIPKIYNSHMSNNNSSNSSKVIVATIEEED